MSFQINVSTFSNEIWILEADQSRRYSIWTVWLGVFAEMTPIQSGFFLRSSQDPLEMDLQSTGEIRLRLLRRNENKNLARCNLYQFFFPCFNTKLSMKPDGGNLRAGTIHTKGGQKMQTRLPKQYRSPTYHCSAELLFCFCRDVLRPRPGN